LSVPILLKQPNPSLDPPLIFYLSRQINDDDITDDIFIADDTGSIAIFGTNDDAELVQLKS
jgi:hypothetical protein